MAGGQGVAGSNPAVPTQVRGVLRPRSGGKCALALGTSCSHERCGSASRRRRRSRRARPSRPRSAIERALSRRDVPLREKTLWRMLYGTAARTSRSWRWTSRTSIWTPAVPRSAPRAATPNGHWGSGPPGSGLGVHSADQILRQFQDVKVSDEFELGPNRPKMSVGILDPEQLFTAECRPGNLLLRASTRRPAASSDRAAPLARWAMLTRPRVPLPFLTGRAAMGASHPCWSRQEEYRAWSRPSASA
jgi:hypothetical protein